MCAWSKVCVSVLSVCVCVLEHFLRAHSSCHFGLERYFVTAGE